MKKLLIIIFTLIILPLSVKAEEVTLTLDEAVTIGLRDNKDVLLKAEDVKKAKAKIVEAKSSLFPSLTGTLNWSDTKGLYSKDLSATQLQLGLKQIIYNGGKIISSIGANKYSLVAAEAILDKAQLDLVASVKKAFYLLLFSYDYADINKQIMENTQEHLDFISQRYKNGQASQSDVLKLESSLSDVKQAYEFSLNQLASTQEILNNLLSLKQDVQLKPEGKLDCEPKEVAYDKAFIQAMQERPEIKQFEAQAKASEKNIEAAKAGSRPLIYASWDYYNRTHLTGATTRNQNDYNIIGVTVSWPIFDGWLTKSKVDQAIVDFKESVILKDKTVRDVASDLKYAYLDLKNSIEKMKSVQDQLKVYQDNASVYEKKYEAGIVSLLDLHDANLSREVALFNQQQSIYDYLVAKTKFDRAVGGK